jgi:hypothetical protein
MAYNFPSNPSLNDTYSYGGRTFVWNGVQWVQVGGTDGLTPKVLVSSSPPLNPVNGSLWFSTTPTSPGLYVWTGSWVPANSSLTPDCGTKSTVSTSPPLEPLVGDLWFNPQTSELSVWVSSLEGDSWQSVYSQDCTYAPTVIASSSPPGNPQLGDLWFDTVSLELSVRVSGLEGNYWQNTSPEDQCPAKPTVTSSSSPPGDPQSGDLWFNPESSVLSVWYQDLDSSQWVVIVPYTQSLLPASEGDGQILISASNSSFGVSWTDYINGGTF